LVRRFTGWPVPDEYDSRNFTATKLPIIGQLASGVEKMSWRQVED
jgi:hypothetical protein